MEQNKDVRDMWRETGEYDGPKDWWYHYYVTGIGINWRRKSDWKRAGLLDDLDLVLKEFIDATHCLCCDVEFDEVYRKNQKVMNHCHETRYFLNIICWECNIREHNIKGTDRQVNRYDLEDCDSH